MFFVPLVELQMSRRDEKIVDIKRQQHFLSQKAFND